MAKVFLDFPGLAEQEANADQTAKLLTMAARQVSALVPGETWDMQAERLRQAAAYAGIAVSELHRSVGWYEAAAAARSDGILEREENEP
jgi:hypothetical protein